MIRKLTEYYLQLRAPHALAMAEVHFDTANPHVHVMISANELHSNKRVRVSKRDFADIKTALEQLQIELYPKLTKSVCQKPKHGFWQRSKDFGVRLAASLAIKESEIYPFSRRISGASRRPGGLLPQISRIFPNIKQYFSRYSSAETSREKDHNR